MILIVDSGSTKSDWALLNSEGEFIGSTQTIGLNPNYVSVADTVNILQNSELGKGLYQEASQVDFYGAGCSTKDAADSMNEALSKVFPNAKVNVLHDMEACAKALYKGEPLIAGILGTGSNSCFYDGKTITNGQPSLGFIMADEGSGNYFGKQLLKAYFYGELNQEVTEDLARNYSVNLNDVVHNLYREPRPNQYIASYMPFFTKHREDNKLHAILVAGFKEYFKHHILCFPNAKELPVAFVGSVAAHFESELREAAQGMNINITEVIAKPIEGLIRYYAKTGW